ncbi:MAG: ATP-grasp domain-containing protein [Chlorobi bacterium]|nr:ATP-grasp domain-containing protein [Chlorobiota bacterium]
MFFLDKPYISDILIKTVKENNYPVVRTTIAEELIKEEKINFLEPEEAVRFAKENPHTRVYTNSENSIAWIAENLSFTGLPEKINIFKDKIRFRELIKDIYPDFVYKAININDIAGYTPSESDYPFVIKPAVGFFSLGVYIVHNKEQWKIAQKELAYKNLQSFYPKEVIDGSMFIIEEYIEGEEYAVDCYFDENGNVVILDILHHMFSSGTDTSDRVYYTSTKVIQQNIENITIFLSELGKRAGLTQFPAHVELRIGDNGKIAPIEVNPLRFGGWCTTADLTLHAYGFNPYVYFMENKKPDWEKIFREKEGKLYSIIILNNNSGIPESKIKGFDIDLFKSDMENLLEFRELDIHKYPVFGFAFAETSENNKKELTDILISDLKRYVIQK